MNRRAFLSSALFAATAAGCGIRPSGGFRPFTFIQMADPQLGFSAGGDGNNFTAETARIEAAVAGINRIRPYPSFMAVCGDLTHLPGHPAQIAEYKRLMGLVNPKIPVRALPGNHDFHVNLTAESIDFYRKTYGPERYAFDLNGWRFIMLNSVLLQLPEKRPEELEAQTEWLRKTLEEATRSRMRGIIAFMHHPFADSDIQADSGRPSIGRTYLDLLSGHGAAAVFSGHTHRTVPEKWYRGVRLINTNGLCRAFDNQPGMRLVTVREDGISHAFYSPDGLPENIDPFSASSVRLRRAS
ncbi:MAG: metallophosphoesterase [Candidatus Latescibacterota bacterium]